MKRSVRILAVVMVIALLCVSMVACGKKLSGEYYFGDKEFTKSYTTYEFSGSKVVCSVYVLGQKVTDTSFEGKYAIKDDEITFTWEVDGEEKSNTVAFEELENGNIKIGAIEFAKAD